MYRGNRKYPSHVRSIILLSFLRMGPLSCLDHSWSLLNRIVVSIRPRSMNAEHLDSTPQRLVWWLFVYYTISCNYIRIWSNCIQSVACDSVLMLICDSSLEPSLYPTSDQYRLEDPQSLSWKTVHLQPTPDTRTRVFKYADLTNITIGQTSKTDTRVRFAQALHSFRFAIKLRVNDGDLKISIDQSNPSNSGQSTVLQSATSLSNSVGIIEIRHRCSQ